MISTKDLSGLPNAERLKKFCKGLAALDIIMLEEEWNFIRHYTQTFNKMGFIETEERDEIYMALRGILDALPGDMLQKDALIEKFEELRDF